MNVASELVAFVFAASLSLVVSLFATFRSRHLMPRRSKLTLAWWIWAVVVTLASAQIYGLREIYGDTEVYHQTLLLIQELGYTTGKDWLFNGIAWILLQFMSVHAAMIGITMLVCFGMWLGIARYMQDYAGSLAATAVMFTSFFCIGMQSNIVRHGMAMAILLTFLPELLRADSGWWAFLKAAIICILASGFHDSVRFIFIPCLIVTHAMGSRIVLAIGIAVVAGMFSILNIGIERLPFLGEIMLRTTTIYGGYLENVKDSSYYRVGFRLEFFVFVWFYALWGIYAWAKLGVKDRLYERTLVLYLLSQSVFVCSFNIPFSDRIGLFCFFLIPVLVCYPFVRAKVLLSTDAWLALHLYILSNFVFTFSYFGRYWL